jgi:hypothetical protein
VKNPFHRKELAITCPVRNQPLPSEIKKQEGGVWKTTVDSPDGNSKITVEANTLGESKRKAEYELMMACRNLHCYTEGCYRLRERK